MIDESVLFVYRNRYTELLKEKMRRSPEEMDLYLQAVDNFLAVGNYSDALLLGGYAGSEMEQQRKGVADPPENLSADERRRRHPVGH